MIFNINPKKQQYEEHAKEFCLAIQREYGVRIGHFKPCNSQERKWLAEGIVPLLQFEIISEMIAGAMHS